MYNENKTNWEQHLHLITIIAPTSDLSKTATFENDETKHLS